MKVVFRTFSKVYLLLFLFHGLLLIFFKNPRVWFLEMDIKYWIKSYKLKRKTSFLLQDDLPGVEPLQVAGSQQGVKEAGHHDDERQ